MKIIRNILLTAGMTLALWACGNASTTATPTGVQTEAAAATDTATAALTGSDSDECLACHVDKQRLIDTAAPLAAAESESKGVG